MKKYIFDRFNFSSSYKKEITALIKSLSNFEIGGKRLYDGSDNHYMQNPYEIVDLIFELKRFEKSRKFKFKSFLEIGFAAGINNTILNKFFKFQKIVAVDIIDPAGINKNYFYANLRFKNLSLICGDSTDKKTINNVKSLGKFDLIFIDGGHDYNTVKKDFDNYKTLINSSGIIVFHDIKSNLDLGVPKFWDEIKRKYKKNIDLKKYFILAI